jgi:hypothetical protein
MNTFRALWKSKNRRFVFLAGLCIFLLAIGYLAILSGAREVTVTEAIPLGAVCRDGQNYQYVYEVAGKSYSIVACTPTVLSSVTYFPFNPSIAVHNSPVIHTIIGSMFATLGFVMAIGTIFAKDVQFQE